MVQITLKLAIFRSCAISGAKLIETYNWVKNNILTNIPPGMTITVDYTVGVQQSMNITILKEFTTFNETEINNFLNWLKNLENLLLPDMQIIKPVSFQVVP